MNLKENIARMEQELAEMKAKLKENEVQYPIMKPTEKTVANLIWLCLLILVNLAVYLALK